MKPCACREPHERRRIAPAGGSWCGKTAVLELDSAAGLLRLQGCSQRRRALSLEAASPARRARADGAPPSARSTTSNVSSRQRRTPTTLPSFSATEGRWMARPTGLAPNHCGPRLPARTKPSSPATTPSSICARRPSTGGYNKQNPLRIESAVEAAAIDLRIAREWASHPRRFVVEATPDFLAKGRRALSILREELPACCREHVVTPLEATT